MPAHVYPAINLVGYRLSVSALHKKKLKRYTTAGIWLLAGFLVIFIPTLIYRWSLVHTSSRQQEELDTMTAQIEGMRPLETKYVLLSSKAAGLVDLLQKRISIEPKIVEIYDIMPSGSEIGEVSFGEEAGHLQVTVKARDVFVLGQLLQNITESVGVRFSRVTIGSTKRDSDGIYTVAMELSFENKQ